MYRHLDQLQHTGQQVRTQRVTLMDPSFHRDAAGCGPIWNVCRDKALMVRTNGSASEKIFARTSMITVLFTVLDTLEDSNESEPLSSVYKSHRGGGTVSLKPSDSAILTYVGAKKTVILWRRRCRIYMPATALYNSGIPMSLILV